MEGMKILPDKSIDMILCDMPYGTTACKWDKIIPLEPLWKQLKRVIKSNGAIVLTASQPFTSMLVMSNMKIFKYEWIWDKQSAGNFITAKYQPLKKHENILVFSRGKIRYNPQMVKIEKDKIRPIGNVLNRNRINNVIKQVSKNYNNKIKYPSSLISFGAREKELNSKYRLHPTQKPVALMEYLIKTYTNEGEIVLDFAIGSGTTAVACVNTNRKYIGYEIEKKYYDIAIKRLEAERTLWDIRGGK